MNAHQRRKARRAWIRQALIATFGYLPPRERTTPAELGKLQEYSCSIPTGARPGRRWKIDVVALRTFSFQHQRSRLWRRDGRNPWQARETVRELAARMLPPRWLRARGLQVWAVAEVLEQPHPAGGHVITYTYAGHSWRPWGTS